MTYQNVIFNRGQLLNVDVLSKLTSNDDANYAAVDQKPRGIVFFKNGYNEYSPGSTTLATDTSASHTGSGSASTNPLTVCSATITLQPTRKFYIEGVFSKLQSTQALQVFDLQLYIDNKKITNHLYHIPSASSPSSYCDNMSASVWGFYDTADKQKESKVSIELRMKSVNTSLVSGVAKNNILKTDLSDSYFWLKVEDWGSMNQLETMA